MTHAPDRFIAAFNAAHDGYAAAGAGFLDQVAALLVARTNPAPGAAAVDIATGPGTVARPLLSAIGERGSLIGIDRAERQLQLARAVFPRGSARVRFFSGDAAGLDLADHSADVVTCSFGLPYFEEPVRAIREAVRVARPGAAVALSTWGAPFFGPPGLRFLTLMEQREVTPIHRPLFSSSQELAGWAIRAGLEAVVVEEHDLPLRFADFEAWWAMNRAFGFLVRLEAGDAETSAEIREALESDPAVIGPSGEVTLTLRVLIVHGRA